MKTKLFVFLLIAMLVVSLAACKVKDKNNGGGADNNGTSDGDNNGGSSADGAPVEKGIIFSPNEDARIVRSADEPGMVLDEIFEAYYLCTNSFAEIRDDSEEKVKHEIVIGDSNRPITAKAMAALESGLKRTARDWEDRGLDTTFLIGYAVYSDGESVAVVWSDENAQKYAFEYFIENYFHNPTLELENGYVNVKGIDRIEALREEEAVEREAVYAKIADEYGWDVANALKAHLSMFDERYYQWLANLYNPGEYDENGNPLGGGFYYSNSGRDNVGYLIDLESTMQALSWITSSSGMFSGQAQARETLPASMLDEMAAFALSCQSSTDGYFYHPQWGANIGTSRLGRDLSWATQILSYCQVKPYWNTPNNTAGFYGEPSGDDSVKSQTISEYRATLAGVTPASSLSNRLSGSSSVTAASKVLATAGGKKWNGSSWLATLDAWEAYLQSYDANIHTSSYSIGNNFSAQSGQINTRDKLAIENGELPDVRKVDGTPGSDGIADGGYREMWKKYFDNWQFENGLWEECSLEDGTVYYNAINGLMKISSCYDSLGISIPRPVEAFKCAVFMATYFGNGQNTGNDAQDWKDSKGKAPTNSVDVYNPWVAMSHILSIVGDTDKALREELRQITKDNALEMIKATTRKIAKFSKNDGSYGYSWTYSPANSQGAPVAVPSTVEGDINGGNIAFTGTFGSMRGVLGITSELKPFAFSDGLLFAEMIKDLSPVLKDDGSLSGSSETGERNFDSEEAGNDKPEDVTITLKEGSAVIVADPDNEKNKYLQFNAVPGESGNSFSFSGKQVTGATSIVLEFKIKFAPLEHTNGTDFQIKMQPSYMLTLSVDPKNGTFKLGDAANTGTPNISQWFSDNVYNAYEWNTVRVEFYVLDADEKSTVANIYVNGQLRNVSTNYWLKASDETPKATCKSVSFFTLKGTNLTAYFDDLYFGQSTDPYVPKPVYDPDLVKDFDSVEAGSDTMPDGIITTGGAIVSSPTEENPKNNILVLDSSGEKVTISSAESYATPNCYSFNAMMKIDAESVGTVANILMTGKDTAKIIAAYKVVVYEENGEKLAKLVEYSKDGKEGKSMPGLPLGDWFTLTVEFYPYFYLSDECAIAYVNGKEIGRGNTYYHVSTISVSYYNAIIETTGNATVSLDDASPDRIVKTFVKIDGTEIPDPDIKLPLTITAKDETITINATKAPTTPNCYTVTTKLKIEAKAVGAIANFYIAAGDAAKAIAAYRVETYSEGGKTLARLVEFTKDGKDGKTITGLPVGESFILTIEFYPYFYESDNCAIVYVNGEEVGRGNTYYYVGTLASSYTKFIATMTVDGAIIYFEDSVASSTFKKFVNDKGEKVDDPDVELPSSGVSSSTAAAADHDGRFDFEGVELGTPKVPGLSTSVNTHEYGYWLDIKQDPTNAANQVLSHIVVPSSNYGNSATYTASKNSVGGANCYVLEFDVLIASGSAGDVQTSFNGTILGADGKSRSVKLFQTNTSFRGTCNDATVQIKSKRDVAESLTSYVDSSAPADESKNNGQILAATKVSGWVNIRFELYTDQAKAKIYYDGEYRGETDLVYTNQMKATFTSATIYTTYGSRQELYFDNVIVEAIKKTYVAETCANPTAPVGDGSKIITPDDGEDEGGDSESGGEGGITTPDTPVVPEEPVGPTYPEGFDGTYDFQDQQVGGFNVYGATTSLPGGGYVMIMEDSRSAAGRVLQFCSKGGSGSKYNEHVLLETYKVTDAKKYVFEWEMMFESASKQTDLVQLSLGSYMPVIYTNGDGTYSIGDMSSSAGADAWYRRQNALIANVPMKEWHKITIEYAVINNQAMIKLYLDGILQAVSDNFYGKDMALPSDTDRFTGMKFRSMQSAEFVVNLDNIKLYGSTEEMTVVPYTHEIRRPATIVEGAVNDFDNVNSIKYDTADPVATYTVVDDPISSAVNKVLRVSLQNANQNFDGNTIATHNLSEAKNVGVYELSFDMYIDATKPAANKTLMQFVMHNDFGYAMLFTVQYKSDGTIRITQDSKSAEEGQSATLYTESLSGGKLPTNALANGKWHNIRLIVECNGLDSFVHLYIDGVKKGGAATYFYDAAVTHTTPIKSVTWRVHEDLYSEESDVNLYFDDMYFVYAGELK